LLRDTVATRRAFHNWIQVGIVAGMAVGSRIPPRHGWKRLQRRRLLFRTRMGPVLETDAGNATAIVEIFRNGEYAVPLNWQRLRQVLDVGAHVGAFTCWVGTLNPDARIVAFEPEPANFRDLQANVTRNHMQGRVTLLNVAVASRAGHRGLVVPSGRERASMVAADTTSPHVTVPTVDFDDYLRHHCEDTVDLLKMDCEGAEWEVLGSLTEAGWRRIDRLLLECHTLGVHQIATMEALLDRAGLSQRTIHKTFPGSGPLGDTITLLAERVNHDDSP